ncbi:MAG TPA: hypothetical protein VED63_03025 [Acidimicrobiales bacterium]|nr:hypothetical protein [Acidimicrobiales bacterium]
MTGDAVPAAVEARAGAEAVVMPDAFLLTEDANGQLAVPSLTLVVDATGLTVVKPDGLAGAVVAWDDIVDLQAAGRMRTPTGAPGLVLEAVTAARTHRFMVPDDRPDELERRIGAMAVGPGGKRKKRRRTPSEPSRTLAVALPILVAVVIALIVLIATGTVKF